MENMKERNEGRRVIEGEGRKRKKEKSGIREERNERKNAGIFGRGLHEVEKR